MNTEVTGLTFTEWLLMFGLTFLFGGWAYFDHHILAVGPYGRVDPLLLAAMLTPGAFFFFKHGETFLRSKSHSALTNQGSLTVMRIDAQAGGESDAMHDKSGSPAIPSLRFLPCGISKPTLPALTKIRKIIAPHAYFHRLGGSTVCMADLSRFDAEQHAELPLVVRGTLDTLPGVTLDEDPVLFGDVYETSWASFRTKMLPEGQRGVYLIPAKPDKGYDSQLEHKLNAEVVNQLKIMSKMKASIDKLKGSDWLGGL